MGKGLRGREVDISLDPVAVEVEWVYAGADGVCHRRQEEEELTAERVRALDVSRHRERDRPARRRNSLSGLPPEPTVR